MAKKPNQPEPLPTALPASPSPEPTPPTSTPRRLVAAIDIGSSAVRLDIGEVREQGEVRLLESLRHGVRLGRDVFTQGRIQQDTLRRDVYKRQGRACRRTRSQIASGCRGGT